MLYGLLITGYVFVCFLLVAIILIQKGKGSTGFGAIGGGSQLLFGGSGGQDIFQKTTWVLGSIFILSSLVLSIMKTRQSHTFKYVTQTQEQLPAMPAQAEPSAQPQEPQPITAPQQATPQPSPASEPQ